MQKSLLFGGRKAKNGSSFSPFVCTCLEETVLGILQLRLLYALGVSMASVLCSLIMFGLPKEPLD